MKYLHDLLRKDGLHISIAILKLAYASACYDTSMSLLVLWLGRNSTMYTITTYDIAIVV